MKFHDFLEIFKGSKNHFKGVFQTANPFLNKSATENPFLLEWIRSKAFLRSFLPNA